MRKSLFAFATLLTMVACNNKTAANAESEEIDEVSLEVVDEQNTDYYQAVKRYLVSEIGKDYAQGSLAAGAQNLDSVSREPVYHLNQRHLDPFGNRTCGDCKQGAAVCWLDLRIFRDILGCSFDVSRNHFIAYASFELYRKKT